MLRLFGAGHFFQPRDVAGWDGLRAAFATGRDDADKPAFRVDQGPSRVARLAACRVV